MDFSEAIEISSKRLRDEKRFKYKTVMFRGEPYSLLISDEDMIKILSFKGTGEKRMFMDLVLEVKQMAFDEFVRILETDNDEEFDPERAPWLYDYIVKNNFQVMYEKGDITVKNAL